MLVVVRLSVVLAVKWEKNGDDQREAEAFLLRAAEN